jgi:hypothetical protein
MLTIMPGFIASSQDGITTIVVVLIIQQPFSNAIDVAELEIGQM